jgi:hypothetical protein
MPPIRLLYACALALMLATPTLAAEPQAADTTAEEAEQDGMAPDEATQDQASPDEATQALPDGEPLDLSTPEPDAGKAKALRRSSPAAPPSDWQGKAGIDYRKPAIPAVEFQPEQLLAGAVPDQSAGVAWANVNAPGPDTPLGWDKTVIESRLDPQDQGKLGTTLSRSVPVGENVSVTLQNGVSVSRTVPGTAQPPAQIWASSQGLQFNLLPTDTSVSLGTAISTVDDKWQRTLSAEQKLFGGPLSVTGSVTETGSGERSKSLKAGFKTTW